MVILILVSLLFSAFFSGSEIAFVSSNKIRLEIDKKNKGFSGWVLGFFYRHREQFITTMLVGNNIALVVYGIGMASLLEPVLKSWWNNEIFVVLCQTLFSTLLILITAEYLPKMLFRIDPNMALRIFSFPLLVIYILLYPISIVTTLLSKGILWISGIKIPKEESAALVSKVDLDFFVQQGIDDSNENSEVETEVKIFQNALDFSNVRLRDCMVPRAEIVAVDMEKTDEKVLISKFIETGLSKVLVYKDSLDNVVGYIHSSEMFWRPELWKQQIKPISIAPETMPAQKLMKDLMLKKRSMSMVVDEFGGISGIITLEDLVEEIFGDIEDEHDTNRLVAKQVGEAEYEVSGRLEIEKLNELFDLDFPESEDYITVAGYILHYYQTIPKQGESIEIRDYLFRILKRKANKIELVNMKHV